MLRLRRAHEADCALLFRWVNEKEARRCSIRSEPVAWETHVAWFYGKRNAPDCLLLIAEDEQNTPVGQIRFDVCAEEATVSISLDGNQRGKGYGSEIISQGAAILFEGTSIRAIHAWIRTGNSASQRAFLRAGFCSQGLQEHHGLCMFHYTLPA